MNRSASLPAKYGATPQATQPPPTSWKNNLVISWTGMRGVVTLAAASGLPLTAHGHPFPGRAGIQFVAFVVAVGTLLIQGITLPLLVRRLHLSTAEKDASDQAKRRQARRICRAASKTAAREFLADPPDGVDPIALGSIAQRLRAAQDTRAESATADDQDQKRTARRGLLAATGLIRQRMLSAQRSALVRERDAGTLNDEVLRDVLEQLDYEEAATLARIGFLTRPDQTRPDRTELTRTDSIRLDLTRPEVTAL